MKTKSLIITILLTLATPALSNHNGGDFRRFARQDQPNLESAVFDEDDEFSVLDMAEVRIPIFALCTLSRTFFVQDMLQVGLKPFLGYVLNGLIVVSLFLLMANILQITLFPLVSAVRFLNYHLSVKMSSFRGFRRREGL